jgi:hypothetical protein
MLVFMYLMPRGVVGTLGPWLAHAVHNVVAKSRSARSAAK